MTPTKPLVFAIEDAIFALQSQADHLEVTQEFLHETEVGRVVRSRVETYNQHIDLLQGFVKRTRAELGMGVLR